MGKHLWEGEHTYYCNEGNYYSNSCGGRFYSFKEFLSEWGEADFDYNLLFRWDWIDSEKENLELEDEDKMESDLLKIFWMLQRKGDYRYCIINVNKEDEEEVSEFLKPRLEHLKSLWQPLE